MTTRANQGGSVAVFLVISAVFAMAVIIGMYAVQKRNDQVQTAPVVSQTDAEKGKEQKDTSSDDAATKQAEQEAEQQKQVAEKKAAEEKAAKEKLAQEAKDRQQAEQTTPQQTAIPQTSTAPAASEQHLPQTGPSDTTWQVVSGAILLGVTIAYLKSYRYRFGSLLKTTRE